ncbi:head decoration protein [Stenotrophomonas maltophilia]|uniref:head decoration protein n=1 Tax=Stenotrophomonas maltophilia TaxID=40324 RepID=UPI000D448CF4|nr:head decoration protein [Stenotrophomonas maltophilia]MCF3495703.1 head decoration protein [Stenotrophomonas maltophilia]PSD20555.1 head decoration protein [Stenotrophomonas maltophilia]
MEISLAGTRTGEFLLSEAGGERSRELIRLPAGQGMLAAGTLLKADNTVATNGADAVKVLYGPVDTGANAGELAVKGAAIARDAEVFGEKLVWADGVTDDQKLLAALSLAESGIITRWTQQPIASNAADHLVFVSEPLTGTAGVALGPIVVHVKDVFGALVTGSTVSATLAKASGTGNLAGGGAKSAVGGVITWDAATLSAAGDYTLKVTATDLGEAISDTITIAAAAGG